VEEPTALVERALEEDVGSGDITTQATVEPGARGRALITQKAPGVIFGLRAAELAMLLDGVDWQNVRRSQRYRRPAPA